MGLTKILIHVVYTTCLFFLLYLTDLTLIPSILGVYMNSKSSYCICDRSD